VTPVAITDDSGTPLTLMPGTVERRVGGRPRRKKHGRNMSLKPDFGIRLMNEGYAQDVTHHFYDCHLVSLTVLGEGQYSTTVETPFEGQVHALSLDFTEEQLQEILSQASPALITFLHDEIMRDPTTPRTIDFEDL
jgi:hypothetical protein